MELRSDSLNERISGYRVCGNVDEMWLLYTFNADKILSLPNGRITIVLRDFVPKEMHFALHAYAYSFHYHRQ